MDDFMWGVVTGIASVGIVAAILIWLVDRFWKKLP